MIPLLIAMAVGPMLKWKRSDLREANVRLREPIIASFVVIFIVLAFTLAKSYLAALAFGLAMWIVAGTLVVLANRIKLGQASLETTLNLARTTPRSFYGLVIAHAGMGLTVAGIAGMSAAHTDFSQI